MEGFEAENPGEVMSTANDNQELSSEAWFADLIGDGSKIADQLKEVKEFAYNSFDSLDKDGNGFLSCEELELACNNAVDLNYRQRSFLKFLLDNHEQISEAYDDGDMESYGVSREDLESYFELIATLL